MTRPSLTYWDYITEAFGAKPAVPGLGPIPVNKLLVFGVGILGLVNPGFWFAGAALEMGYLWFLSTDGRFQKYCQSLRMNVVELDKAQRINEMVRTLDKQSTTRLESLNANLSQINRLMDMNSEGPVQFVKETKQKTISQLPVLFLKLLVTRKLITDSLERTDIDKLKNEIKELTHQLDSPEMSEALSKSVRGTIEIQQKRLDNIRRAQDNLRLVEMELNRIENQLQLIREEIALDRSPESVTAGIDRINNTLGETEQWMDTHSEFFNKFQEPEMIETPAPLPPMVERE